MSQEQRKRGEILVVLGIVIIVIGGLALVTWVRQTPPDAGEQSGVAQATTDEPTVPVETSTPVAIATISPDPTVTITLQPDDRIQTEEQALEIADRMAHDLSEKDAHGRVVSVDLMTLKDAFSAAAKAAGDDPAIATEGFSIAEETLAVWRLVYEEGTFPAFKCPQDEECGSQSTAVFILDARDGSVWTMQFGVAVEDMNVP